MTTGSFSLSPGILRSALSLLFGLLAGGVGGAGRFSPSARSRTTTILADTPSVCMLRFHCLTVALFTLRGSSKQRLSRPSLLSPFRAVIPLLLSRLPSAWASSCTKCRATLNTGHTLTPHAVSVVCSQRLNRNSVGCMLLRFK